MHIARDLAIDDNHIIAGRSGESKNSEFKRDRVTVAKPERLSAHKGPRARPSTRQNLNEQALAGSPAWTQSTVVYWHN